MSKKISVEEAINRYHQSRYIDPGTIIEGTPEELATWREFFEPALGHFSVAAHLREKDDANGTAEERREAVDRVTSRWEAEKDDANPKDLLGIKKAPLRLVPRALRILAAPAMALGAAKYGPYNWREKGVKLSVYLEAMDRHLDAYFDRQDLDDESGYSHLSHVAACLAIIADAQAIGKLIDDRPVAGGAASLLKEQDGSAN